MEEMPNTILNAICWFFERVWKIVLYMCGFIVSATSPVHDVLFAFTVIFVINFFAGVWAGVWAQHERFSKKKAMESIGEAFCITGLIVMTMVIGNNIDNPEGATSVITAIIYATIYFYSSNILKNLTRIFPNSRLFSFLDYVISFEMIKKIPYMENFKKKKP